MSFLAISFKPVDQSDPVVDNIYIEEDSETVARNLEKKDSDGEPLIDYYQINVGPAPNYPVSTHPVTLKGARDPGPTTEVVTVEANGQDVGSAVVEA
jgi:hypothetical protein